VEKNRWTDECTEAGDWPEGVWLRWFGSDGLGIGPGIPMPESVTEPQWLHWEEGSGGLVISEGVEEGIGGNRLFLNWVSPAGDSLVSEKELIGDDSFTSVGADAVWYDSSYWVVWVERKTGGKPFRIRAQRFDEEGNSLYPAQPVSGNLSEELSAHGPFVTTHPGSGVCAYWREASTLTGDYWMKRACLTEYGTTSGEVVEVAGPSKVTEFEPHSIVALAEGGALILGRGLGALSDSDSACIQALKVDADGTSGSPFQVNLVEEGHQDMPVGLQRPGGAVDVFWRVQGGPGNKEYHLASTRVAPLGVVLEDESQVSETYDGAISPPSLAAAPDGLAFLLWKAEGAEGVFKELWARKIPSRCYADHACLISEPVDEGCVPLGPAGAGASCVSEDSCAASGHCDEAGQCHSSSAWPDGASCSTAAGALDLGACDKGECAPVQLVCPQETACTEWTFKRLEGCIPESKCCGNGKVDELEPCDDGEGGSDWCSPDCEVVAIPLTEGDADFYWSSDRRLDSLIDHEGDWNVTWVTREPATQELRRVWLVELEESVDSWSWKFKDVEFESPQGKNLWMASLADLPDTWGLNDWETNVLVLYPPNNYSKQMHWLRAFGGAMPYALKHSDDSAGQVDCDTSGEHSACFFSEDYYPDKQGWTPRLMFAYSGFPATMPDWSTGYSGNYDLHLDVAASGRMLATLPYSGGSCHFHVAKTVAGGYDDETKCQLEDASGCRLAALTGDDSFAFASVSGGGKCGAALSGCFNWVSIAECDGSLEPMACSATNEEGLAPRGQATDNRVVQLGSGQYAVLTAFNGVVGLSSNKIGVATLDASGIGIMKPLRFTPHGSILFLEQWGKYIGVLAHDGSDELSVWRIPIVHIENVLGL